LRRPAENLAAGGGQPGHHHPVQGDRSAVLEQGHSRGLGRGDHRQHQALERNGPERARGVQTAAPGRVRRRHHADGLHGRRRPHQRRHRPGRRVAHHRGVHAGHRGVSPDHRELLRQAARHQGAGPVVVPGAGTVLQQGAQRPGRPEGPQGARLGRLAGRFHRLLRRLGHQHAVRRSAARAADRRDRLRHHRHPGRLQGQMVRRRQVSLSAGHQLGRGDFGDEHEALERARSGRADAARQRVRQTRTGDPGAEHPRERHRPGLQHGLGAVPRRRPGGDGAGAGHRRRPRPAPQGAVGARAASLGRTLRGGLRPHLERSGRQGGGPHRQGQATAGRDSSAR